MDKVSESLLKRFLDASNLTGLDAAVCTGAAVFVPLYWWYLGDDMKTKRNFVHSILNLLIFLCPLGKVLIMCFRGFQDSWLYELVIVVVSFTPALIKWLTSSARPAPTRGPTDPDNGKKTSGSTSTESVEQPGRGGGANGLQEKTDHGGRGHPGMLEQPTTVDGGAQDTKSEMVQPTPDRPFLGDNGWKYDIFLLHAGQNKKFVEDLYQELCSKDILPFFDKCSLPIGTKAQDLIMEALQTTSRFIVPVLSHEIKGKSYPENEMKKAVDRFERFKESGVQSPPVLIVPVFYLTTPDECHESTNQFVKDMSAFTGIVRQEDDEDAYLRAVAEEITKMVKQDGIKFQDVVEALENMTAKGSSCQPQPLGPEPDQGGVTVQQKEKSPYEIMKNLVVDNGKKTSGSTSTESVEQPGRGGGANGLQEETDHGGRGHPGMLEQSTAVDGGAQDTNLPLSDLHKRAEEKATQEELRDVAKEVQAVWPDFATHLDSYMFTAARISVIRRNSGLYPSEFICAKFMLEKWAQNQDRKATRRRLIKAMYDNDLIAEARKVFETTHKYHGLVEYVLKSTGGK